MGQRRQLPNHGPVLRLALGLVLAGSFVAACQANQPSSPAATQPAVRRPTPDEAVKLIQALGTYQQAALLEDALTSWRRRDRIRTAERHWEHFQGLVRQLANRAARQEFVAFMAVHGTPATASIGALGGWGVLAAPRIVPSTLFHVAAPNQCAFTLPGQEPLSHPALRWLGTGQALDKQSSTITQQILDWAEEDTAPVPMTDAEIAAYEQWRSDNPAPIPMTDEEVAWAEQQRAGSGGGGGGGDDSAPIPMTDEEIQAIRDAAGSAPPFTEQLLNWIDQYEQDSAPQPMTPEEVAWADQQRAESTAPVPMTDEEAAIADQERADSGTPYAYEDPAAPVPMTDEEAAWAAQQRADSGAPYPMDEQTVDAYGQWIEDGAPVPMTEEEIQAYGQWVDDGAPIPMTEEEIAWADQQRADSGVPYPMDDPGMEQAYENWLQSGEPIPMTGEEIAWTEHQRAESTAPVPMTDEEIAAVEAAARNRTLDISDEDWTWILDHNGMGSTPNQPPPPTCAWFIDGTFTNSVGATGHSKGQKCGDPTGKWVVDGTYSFLGMNGTQQWVIEIDANGSTGTYAYTTDIKGHPGGGPVAVHVTGTASGTVTLTIAADGSAHMVLKETTHQYRSDIAIELAPPNSAQPLDWQVGGTC